MVENVTINIMHNTEEPGNGNAGGDGGNGGSGAAGDNGNNGDNGDNGGTTPGTSTMPGECFRYTGDTINPLWIEVLTEDNQFVTFNPAQIISIKINKSNSIPNVLVITIVLDNTKTFKFYTTKSNNPVNDINAPFLTNEKFIKLTQDLGLTDDTSIWFP